MKTSRPSDVTPATIRLYAFRFVLSRVAVTPSKAGRGMNVRTAFFYLLVI